MRGGKTHSQLNCHLDIIQNPLSFLKSYSLSIIVVLTDFISELLLSACLLGHILFLFVCVCVSVCARVLLFASLVGNTMSGEFVSFCLTDVEFFLGFYCFLSCWRVQTSLKFCLDQSFAPLCTLPSSSSTCRAPAMFWRIHLFRGQAVFCVCPQCI